MDEVIQEELKVYGGIFLIDLLIFSILLLQNISIHFNKYKKEIVVKRLYGFGYVKAYRKYWTIFLINWVIIFFTKIRLLVKIGISILEIDDGDISIVFSRGLSFWKTIFVSCLFKYKKYFLNPKSFGSVITLFLITGL